MDESDPIRLIPDSGDLDTETLLEPPPQDPQQDTQGSRRWVMMRHSNVWRPPTDVFELEDRLVVMVEIAGMRDGEFNVVLQDRRLSISGVRRRTVQERTAFHQMEVRYGEFRAEVMLPWPVSRDSVSALYRDGFLRVELPHAPNQQISIVDVDLEQDPID